MKRPRPLSLEEIDQHERGELQRTVSADDVWATLYTLRDEARRFRAEGTLFDRLTRFVDEHKP